MGPLYLTPKHQQEMKLAVILFISFIIALILLFYKILNYTIASHSLSKNCLKVTSSKCWIWPRILFLHIFGMKSDCSKEDLWHLQILCDCSAQCAVDGRDRTNIMWTWCQTVLNHYSSSLQLPHATVSCVECVSVALLFEQVLLSFFGCDAASLLPRSPSLSDFVRIYRQQCSQSPAKETRYIVSAVPFTLNQKITLYKAKYSNLCHVSNVYVISSDNIKIIAKQSSKCVDLESEET